MKKFFEKIIPGLLIAAPVLIAVFVIPDLTRPFDFSKMMLLRVLLFVVLLLGLLQFFLKKELKISSGFFSSRIAFVVLMMLSVIFLATIASPQRLNSIWGTYERGLGLIAWLTYGAYFFLPLLYLEKRHVLQGLKVLIFGTTLVALYGIGQSFGFDPIFFGFDTDFLEGRIFSTLGNPDFLAQLLAPVIALALFFTYAEKKVRGKILYAIPSIIMFIAMLETESRASLLALIFGLLFFIFLLAKNKKRLLLIGGGAFLIFILGVQLGLPTLERFQINTENFRSAQSRFITWDVAIHAIMDHPILGLGPDNFEIYFPEYMKPDFYYLEEDLNISADRAHNETLEMGLIGGFPLMILYWLLIAIVLQQLVRSKKKTLPAGIALALLVIFMQNQLTFSQATHFVLIFYLLAGLIITTESPKSINWKSTSLFRYVGTILILIFLGFTFIETVVHRAYAELFYTYALTTENTKYGLTNAIAYAPLETKFRYNMLMWYPEERPIQIPALREIEGDTIEVLAWTANYTLNVDTEEAYALFEQVIELNPLYPHTSRAYADGLYVNEDFELAAKYYEDYFALVPDFWTWCPDLESLSEYEQKKFRIFYKNVPDFNNALIHLYNSYVNLGEQEKVEELDVYLECLLD